MTRYRQIAVLILFAGFVAALPSSAPGQFPLAGGKPKSPVPATEKNVKDAIQRGAAFLRKRLVDPKDVFAFVKDLGHPIGVGALSGLALLEAGVDPKDESIQVVARMIREAHGQITFTFTYDISLALLFLDRLGEKEDEAQIRHLALRLIAGQTTNGGWSYGCPLLKEQDEERLLAFLRKNQPFRDPLQVVEHAFLVPLGKPGASLPTALPKPEQPLLTPLDKNAKPLVLPIPFPKEDPPTRSSPNDRSTGKPPGEVPPKANKSTEDVEKKSSPPKTSSATTAPAPSQTAKPGGDAPSATPGAGPAPKPAAEKKKPVRIDPADWPSVPEFVAKELRNGFGLDIEMSDNSNTQFAILALWAARRHDIPAALSMALLDRRFRTSQLANGTWPYTTRNSGAFHYGSMTCVGLLGLGASHASFREVMQLDGKQAFTDPVMKKAIQALGRLLRQPAEDRVNPYFLWSIERVAVMYRLKKIENQDWFTWGAQALLRHQQADGSWHTRGFHGSVEPVDTSMAILFLCRSHLNRDLTDRLNGFLQVAP
jgi:hypothetical protein